MQTPRPYGLSVQGGELTDKDNTFIQATVLRFTNYKQTNQLESLRTFYDLPDGGYFVVQDMGGIFKVIAYKDEIDIEKIVFDGLAKLYVPMLFSGVITRPIVRVDDELGIGMNITQQTRLRLANYDFQRLPGSSLNLHKFKVRINMAVVGEFQPPLASDEVIHTQYSQQRPTWYSGAMSEVMQVVGGYGIQDVSDLPDTQLERARFVIPSRYLERIAVRLDNIRLPGYSGIPPMNGQYQYDYKFNHSNAVVFGVDNTPWLLRISSEGVYAMPLPLVPATTTPEFLDFVQSVGDNELLNILNRFGGMPSGEGFPTGADFHSWVKSGAIIKVCDTADFYSHNAYGVVCGWSFNDRGTEGVNTCYNYDDDTGILRGYTYMFRMTFGKVERFGWLTSSNFSDHPRRNEIAAYISNLAKRLPEGESRTNAILYKLRRMKPDEILAQMSLRYGEQGYRNEDLTEDDVDQWDNLELEPIAQLQGKISRIANGNLYHPAKGKGQAQFKLPVPGRGECISFDFGPRKVLEGPAPNCDTIIYAYYAENSLKVVKYFADWRSYIKEKEGYFDDVMTVGSWEIKETVGSSSPQGYFYTTDFDYREIFSPEVTHTKLVGEDKGYDTQPYFGFVHLFAMSGSIMRYRYYTHHRTSTRTQSGAINIAACVPYFTRNSVLLAREKSISGTWSVESLTLNRIQDPTSYAFWTYHSVMAWNTPLDVQTGVPYPVDGNPVWVEYSVYSPNELTDFADSGEWLPTPPYDISWLVHPDANVWKLSGGGGPPNIKGFNRTTTTPSSQSGGLDYGAFDQGYSVHLRIPDEGYFLPSPDERGNVFYRDACKVVFGNVTYANISEKDAEGRRYKWGYSRLADHGSPHHFIGVINE